MTYITVKKVITNKKAILFGTEWETFAAETMDKLDVFFLNDRITQNQYNELANMLVQVEESES